MMITIGRSDSARIQTIEKAESTFPDSDFPSYFKRRAGTIAAQHGGNSPVTH